MNRSLTRLYAAAVAGFVAAVAMLGYWQIVAAPGLRDEAGNLQQIQRERLVDRGRITTADGQLLAASRAVRVEGQRVFERVYRRGELAPHAVGYSTTREGRTGVESSANDFLAGSYGIQPILQRLELDEKRGADVRLAIDSRIQQAARDGLAGRAGAVVAIEPTTGAVRAMVSGPDFELSDVQRDFAAIRGREGSPLFNRATAGLYAPGSTFKVVTATAGLSEGGLSPRSVFDDTGSFATPGGPIRNFGNATFGEHTLATALTRSINTTFARVGSSVEAEVMAATMRGFGFGATPPIDLPPGEVVASGRYDGRTARALNESGLDVARLAIGQEKLAVTPLQMAMVAAAIANDGTVMEPYILASARDRGGNIVFEKGPTEAGQAMSADVAAELNEMMQGVVREGTGTAAALAGITSVAGKTGTAETGQEGLNHAWFIGFAPAEQPLVAVAVVIEGTSGQGGTEAAPVARGVLEAAVAAG